MNMKYMKMAALVAVLTMAVAVVVPALATDTSSAAGDEYVSFKSYFESNETTTIQINAGDSEKVEVVAWNITSDHTLNTGGEVLQVKLDTLTLSGGAEGDMSYKVTSNMTALIVPDRTDPDNSYEFVVDVAINQFATGGTAKLVFDFIVMNGPEGSNEISHITYTIELDIVSHSAQGENYDKYLGYISYNGESWIPALVTLIIYLVIFAVLAVFVYPRLAKAISAKKKWKDFRDDADRVMTPLWGLLLTYILSTVCYILGGTYLYLTIVSTVAKVLYIACGAFLLWGIYMLFLEKVVDRKEFEEGSLVPLWVALGKIIIAMGALGWILTELGIDWEYVVTGMGVLGIVLGFGAQSTLTQFFSGLSILCTRPFKKNDIVRLDAGTDVLRVKKVGFMSCTFENWSNAEVFTMPNDKVVSSTIVNVTKGTRVYRIFLFIDVSHNSDTKKVKELILKAAHENEHIVNDGSYTPPVVRLNDITDYSLTFRLAAYVDDFDRALNVAGDLREVILKLFDDNGVEVPYRQFDIHIRADDENSIND